MRYLITIALFILSGVVNAYAALTMALASSYEGCFNVYEHNDAQIRQACIKVHGEEWFKENIIYRRKFSSVYLTLSNCGMMQIRSSYDGLEDLLELKAVFDYMSSKNETLYVDARRDKALYWYLDTSPEEYLSENTPAYFNNTFRQSPFSYLRIVERTARFNSKFRTAEVGTFVHRGVYYETPVFKEYLKKCETEGHLDLSRNPKQELISGEDIDMYFDFIVAHDKLVLESHPKRIVQLGVYYNHNTESRIIFGSTQIINNPDYFLNNKE